MAPIIGSFLAIEMPALGPHMAGKLGHQVCVATHLPEPVLRLLGYLPKVVAHHGQGLTGTDAACRGGRTNTVGMAYMSAADHLPQVRTTPEQ
jgi:hypothetical protein